MEAISVTRLAAACTQSDYLAELLHNPKASPPGPAHFVSGAKNAAPGSVFHDLTSQFVQRLVTGSNAPVFQGSAAQELWDDLYQNLAKRVLLQVATRNAEAAGNLAEALRQFCERLSALRNSRAGVTRWNQVFLASEYSLNNVAVFTAFGKLFVNGRLDNLRSGSQGLQLVDYKMSQGVNRDRDLVQLALYAKLLELSDHRVRVDGALEYYHPQLFVTEVPHAELTRIFDASVLPVVEQLVKAWSSSTAESRIVEDRAHGKTRDQVPIGFAVGLRVGTCLPSSEPVIIPCKALRTHAAVVGAAGSGKTWMAKALAEESILNGTPVLAIDPQGDIVQVIRPRKRDEFADPGEAERFNAYWGRVEPRIYTPGTSHAIRMSLDPIKLIRPQDIQSVPEEARKKEEADSILRETASTVVSLAGITRDVMNHESFLFRLLQHLVHVNRLEVNLRDLATLIREPEAEGFDDDPANFLPNASRDKFARALHSIAQGPNAALFEGGQPLDIGQLIQPHLNSERVPFNVLYLNALDDDQKHQFVASLATAIYRWMVTSLETEGEAVNLLLYLDEARDFLPAGNKSTPCKQPLIRLFTQARKYGVGCLICTQSPRSVDYNVFGNCSTKLIGRLEAAQDVERVGEWFQGSDGRPDWLPGRVGAEQGTFIGRWPGQDASNAGRAFRARLLFTEHSGAWPPHRVESEWRNR